MSHYPYQETPGDATSELHLSVGPRLSLQLGNDLYLALQTHQMMLALLRVAGHAQTAEARRGQLLRAIEGHFWRQLGHDKMPVFPGDPVTFIDSSVAVTAPMPLALLCEKLESLELAKPSSKSFAAKNFAYLKNGLNLSQCETKFLIWSYCHGQNQRSPLPDVRFNSLADRNTFVALMLDEDEGTVSHYFATRRLCSLRLLETSPMSSLDRTQAAGTLRSFLAGSDHFINLVELGHGNQEAILTHLLSAELDAFLDPELLPDEVLEVLSPPFRRLYEQGRSNTPLCAASLHVMVDWMLGVQLTLAELHPIQNLMSFEIAREALKLYAVRCCRQNFALRHVNVLRALRHAVSHHTAPSPWDIAIA